MAAGRDKDIGGLDVAMDYAFRMGGIEPLRDVDSDFEQAIAIGAVIMWLRVAPSMNSMMMKARPSFS
jgi:hypothetical protein